MDKLLLVALVTALWSVAMASSAESGTWDCYPDTWVATDGLGRTVPTHEVVGPPRSGKTVGVFYFLWLGEHGKGGPYDVSRILAANPDAMSQPNSPLWGPMHAFHHWGEPLFGYYLSDDKWVYRKHAHMLSDAGVDVVIFDVTNGFTYPKSYMALCEAWSEVRKDGGQTPQIAFLTPFFDPTRVVRDLYDNLYGKGLYKDLWFEWKGKPLILAMRDRVEPELKDFFTFRGCQPSYFAGPTEPNQWGWLEVYPQHIFPGSDGKPEQVVVGIGQNAQGDRLAAMSEHDTRGRSWHKGKKDERPGAVNYGFNVVEQWERALEIDPEFIFITGWNEWIAMRFNEFNGVKEPVMLVDVFNQEYSRDIEPMKGGHADHYYYQMVDYIRRYKGARPLPEPGPAKTIRIDGSFEDWKQVRPEYRDRIGDTMHRDHPGWGSEGQYVDKSGRNDIVLCKVARDDRHIYFYARTREPLSPHTDPNWMMLLINADRDPVTGWEGYDFIVNRRVRDGAVSLLERSTGGWNWEPSGGVSYRVSGCEIELAIPRAALGLADLSKPLRLDFKWADNILSNGNVMDFTTSGDTAPGWRFAYRFAEPGAR